MRTLEQIRQGAFFLLVAAASVCLSAPKSPEVELVRSCANAATQRPMIELAQQGGGVSLNGKRVTASNAPQILAVFDKTLKRCADADAAMRSPDMSGHWLPRQSSGEHCASMLATAIATEGTVVNARKAGSELAVDIALTMEGKAYSFKATGIAVGALFALTDPGNSDFLWLGEVNDRTVTLRPDIDQVLASWPGWAHPPKRSELETCRLNLEIMNDPVVE